MKLDEIRGKLERHCDEATDYISSIGPIRNGVRWSLLLSFMDAEINLQAMRNRLDLCEFSDEERCDIESIINHIDIEWQNLRREESKALYHLQQEASLASTGPKRSLAQ